MVPYIHTRMLRVTSFDDEVLSHVRERVATNQVYSVVWAFSIGWMLHTVALSL